MRQPMEEPVEVEVLFPARNRHPVPKWVLWRGSREPVEAIHLVHERWECGVRSLVYSLTAGGRWLELRFDPARARWFLDSVQSEDG